MSPADPAGAEADFAAALKRYYSEWWENPRDPRSAVFAKLSSLVAARLPDGRGQSALDIGAGRGTIVSFLLAKGYRVTALEMNQNFVRGLRGRFPAVLVQEADVRLAAIERSYDLVTAIELVQNLTAVEIQALLQKLAPRTRRLHLNVSNRRSLHCWWTARRGFQKEFVVTYTPAEITTWLDEAGFAVVYRKGVGLVTPITLHSGFRRKLVPIWLARVLSTVGDVILPRLCHLYYIEAISQKGGAV